MLDEKILMILLPVWLASVLATLYLGLTRPKAAKIVNALLERGCFDEAGAATPEELGVRGGAMLRMGGSLRSVVACVQEPAGDGSLSSALERGSAPRYYVPHEKKEKALAMYGKSKAGPWQAIVGVLVLTAVFALLWLAGSLVLDTSGWKPLFRI